MTDYDAGTIAQFRLLISDPEFGPAPDFPPITPLFSDDEISSFLDIESGNLKRAAAQAFEVIADNESLILKYIQDHDLTVDGTKVAADMRTRAASLRGQAEDDLDRDGFMQIIPGSSCHSHGYGCW